MRLLPIKLSGIAIIGILIASSCAKEKSTSTGWDYNNYKNGGFEKIDAQEQETGPGLVLIEGGVFTMGRTEQDVMFDWNSRAAKVTVGSFYLDKSEVNEMFVSTCRNNNSRSGSEIGNIPCERSCTRA